MPQRATATMTNPILNGPFALIVVFYARPVGATTYTATVFHNEGYGYDVALGVSGSTLAGYGYGPITAGDIHALLWTNPSATPISLHPAGFYYSWAYAISRSSEVGVGFVSPVGSQLPHALLWHGTAASAIDLNPSDFYSSYAFALSGSMQGGRGRGPTTSYHDHAMLWSGTAASAVDVHPSGYFNSDIRDMSATNQVGSASFDDQHPRAMLWSGTAASAVDLNPTGSYFSEANTVFGNTQAGFARSDATGGYEHSVLWHGTAASALDLNPAGFISSLILDNSATTQVGYGSVSIYDVHALAWNGSADNFIDLHSTLSGLIPNLASSYANCISADGTIIGTAGTADAISYLVVWTPSEVPEPSSCIVATCALAVILMTRQKG
jgi:hypothetical protein